MGVPTRIIKRSMFGKPTLEAGGNGRASWAPPGTIGTKQVTWVAQLDAGVQTSWDDYAKVIIPVNELPFADLASVRLEPYYTESTGLDMAVCVYMHDQNDFDKRMELSHTPYTNTAAGWRELNYPTEPGGSSFFWYGENEGSPDICTTKGTTYTWTQFKADIVFQTWYIYKITLDYGYHTGSGTMDGCYLAQVLINGESILLEPPDVSLPVTTTMTATEATISSASVSQEALAANPSRVYAFFQNDSDTVMYLRLGETSVANEGIRLSASGGWHEINLTNLYRGAVNVLCTVAGKILLVTEGV